MTGGAIISQCWGRKKDLVGQTPHQYLLLKDILKLKQRTLPSLQLKLFRLEWNRSKIFLPLLVADGGKIPV